MTLEFIYHQLKNISYEDWQGGITDGIESMTNRLKAEDKVRIFVDNSANFGHQTSSVLLMKRLIDGFGFKGGGKSVTMVYPVKDADATLAKLSLLIKGLDPTNPVGVTYNTVPLKFMTVDQLDKDPLEININYGFTGGADSDPPNFPNMYAEALKVNCFLRLQPYLWSTPQQIQFGNAFKNYEPENLNENADFGGFLQLRGWYVPDEYWTPTNEDWEYYTNATNPGVTADLAYHSQLAYALIKFMDTNANANAIRLMPCYGIKENNQLGMPPDQLLPTVISTALGGSYLTPAKTPAVVVSMNNSMDDQEYLQSIIVSKGGKTFSEIGAGFAVDGAKAEVNNLTEQLSSGKRKRNLESDLDKANRQLANYQRLSNNQQQEFESRRLWLTTRNAQIGVNVLSTRNRGFGEPVTVEELDQVLLNIIQPNIAKPTVLFLELGALPPLLFNYFMFRASFPSVFEGANTTNTVLNQGRCYLRMVNRSIKVDANMYPIPWVKSKGMNAARLRSQRSANAVLNALLSSPTVPSKFVPNITLTTNYIRDFYFPDDTVLPKYYKSTYAFYHDPINDKLALGLSILDQVADSLKIPILLVEEK
ncbi:MAG: hypothetical protein PHR16_03595 [Methylovulum sp.]|nr:hypothetical protein [Methylovulum sp.]